MDCRSTSLQFHNELLEPSEMQCDNHTNIVVVFFSEASGVSPFFRVRFQVGLYKKGCLEEFGCFVRFHVGIGSREG